MKRALLLALGVALAGAAPAQAADQVVDGRADLVWDKPSVAIAVGEKVTWTFSDTTQYHNVQSDVPDTPDARWNDFASPLTQPAQPASFTFTEAGTYNFVCIVHTTTMRGTVLVVEATADGTPPPLPPPPPPPPLSAQPLANDVTAPPATLEKVDEDKAKPKLSKVSARRSGSRAVRVRFRVSEQATVQVRLKRAGKTVKTVLAYGKGTGSVTVRGAKAGRYSVQVRATDVAGNRSALKRTSVSVR